jgi:hypothetical protein
LACLSRADQVFKKQSTPSQRKVSGQLGCWHGSTQVVCTDGDDTESVVRLAQDNVAHNAHHISSVAKIHVRKYWWDDRSILQTFDVILVADCILPKLYPIALLVKAIDELCLAISVAILSYKHRYYPDYDPRDKFRELCEVRGLNLRVIPLCKQEPVYSIGDIEIWEVQRRQEYLKKAIRL